MTVNNYKSVLFSIFATSCFISKIKWTKLKNILLFLNSHFLIFFTKLFDINIQSMRLDL